MSTLHTFLDWNNQPVAFQKSLTAALSSEI